MQRTSPRAQGLRLREVLPMQALTSWADVAFSSAERDRHLGIRPVSQLNTWPVVSPVNASRRPSRDAAHHSGSGWLAKPSPWGTFTSYSLPAFLAHSAVGQERRLIDLIGPNFVFSRLKAEERTNCALLKKGSSGPTYRGSSISNVSF